MTATTKEQRERWGDLLKAHEGKDAIEADDLFSGLSTSWVRTATPLVLEAVSALPALLSDSERLAAIEAVTGEEVNSVIETIKRRGLLMEAIPVIFSLSAKVAEQAEEISRLEAHLGASQDTKEAYRRRAEAAEAKCSELEAALNQAEAAEWRVYPNCHTLQPGTTDPFEGPGETYRRAYERVYTELNTLRRLLTETAVPALEAASSSLARHEFISGKFWRGKLRHYHHQACGKIHAALSTIRAALELPK